MKLNLRQLFEIVGEKKEFTCSFDFSGEELYGGFPFKTPVECSGEIENRAGVVRLVFCVKFVLDLVCDRCLKPFQREENLKFEHILVQKLNTDNDDYLVCADSVLDLEELVRTDILLELPTKVLCSEDCKGLCSQCGKNLNEGECSCEKKQIDPRLAILSQLLDQDQ